MRVLFISSVFPTPRDPHKGPFNFEMIQNLRAEHEVRVVCPIGWTERRAGTRNARPVRAVADVTYATYYYVPRCLYSFRDVFMWWSVRATLRKLTRGWRPDLFLAYWAHPDGDVARRIAAEVGVPFVQIVGGSDVLLLARGVRKRKITRTLAAAAAVVTVGRHLGQRAIALGAEPSRVTSVYLPVLPAHFSPGSQHEARSALQLPAQAPVVLWVGRFVRVKGLGLLIDAVRQLVPAIPDVRVCLVGDGPEVGRIRALVHRHGLDHVVRFVGPVPHAQLGPWYRAADVTVLSSHSEGVPSVLLESIACGTPFVATDVGGVSEVASASLDRLVPPGRAAALAEALLEKLQGRAEATPSVRMVTTPERFRAQLTRVFERVVARPQTPLGLRPYGESEDDPRSARA